MSETSRRRALQIAISLALAIALFGYFLWRAPLAQVLQQLAGVRPWLLLASVAAALASYFLRALRWGVILRPVGPAAVTDLWGSTAAGFAASTVLPARAGEVVRPLLLAFRAQLPAAGTLASIVTERLADLAAVIFLFGLGVLSVGEGLSPSWVQPLRSAAFAVLVGLLVALALAWLLLHFRARAVDRLARLAPARFRDSVASFLGHLLDGIEVIRSPGRLLLLGAWSLVLWLVIALQALFLAQAFSASLSLAQIFVMIAVSVIGLAVPTPGGVGGFHAAVQFALHQVLGVPLSVASAFALVHHAVCFFPITVIGLAYLAAWGVGFKGMRRISAEEPATGESG